MATLVLALTLAFAAGIVTGIVGQAVLDEDASSTDALPVGVYHPKPYFGAEPGEGPLLPGFEDTQDHDSSP